MKDRTPSGVAPVLAGEGERETPVGAGSLPLAEVELLVVSVTLATSGTVLYVLDRSGPADAAWTVTAAIGTAAATWWVVEAARERRLGVDVVSIVRLSVYSSKRA